MPPLKVHLSFKIKNKIMEKIINKQTQLNIKQAFPGLKGADMFAKEYPIEPVLVFTEYYMEAPVFGPHPHAGVSVMTYMLPDSKTGFINRNSLGDHLIIEPGGLHVSQAGTGMMHDEFPQVSGSEAHGFQIWINHTEANRMVEPRAMHVNAHEVPEVTTDDYKVRIVHGTFNGTTSPLQMVTPVNMLHVFLQAYKSITLDAKEMAFVYVLNGEGKIGDTQIGLRHIINFSEEGNTIVLEAGDNGIEFMFNTATPINEEITYGGPFVMTTPKQMLETKRRYGRGEMGELLAYTGNQ
jgi:quercetin 2,3-dioxygenase